MKIDLRYCSVIFEYQTQPIGKFHITVTRDGKPAVTFEKEDFAEILNTLVASREVANSTETVRYYYNNINPCFYKPKEPEIFVLTTKINNDVKISIMGFEHYTSNTPQKLYTIYIDREDDIFKLIGEFLKFLSNHGDYRNRIVIE
jgi:methyltransferase-like protein